MAETKLQKPNANMQKSVGAVDVSNKKFRAIFLLRENKPEFKIFLTAESFWGPETVTKRTV